MISPPLCGFLRVRHPRLPFPQSRSSLQCFPAHQYLALLIEFLMLLSILGIKAKVENKGQYDEYLRDLEPLREELGVSLKEDLYPEPPKR